MIKRLFIGMLAAIVGLFVVAVPSASANAFSKEVRVAWERMCEGFEDACILSKNVSIYETDQVMMERTNDVIWQPMPYIMQSFDGTDQTNNYQDATELAVPATIGFHKSTPWQMTANQLRDLLQTGRLKDAATIKLASDINIAVMNLAATQGTLFVKRTAAATGFDDVAAIEAIMNEQGIPHNERYAAFSTRDYNGMASNLAGRQTLQPGKTLTAYEKAYVGQICSFDTFKLDYAVQKAAAVGGGGITMSTLVGGANFYVPKATSIGANGEMSPVDNRYQTITVSATANVAAGDAFTVATVDSVHHITKSDTGQLKTFRVMQILTGTTMVISPPMITAQGATDAEKQYKNCVVNTPAGNSALVFLNTTAAAVNPFWQKDAIQLLPGRIAFPEDVGANVMRYTTENGIEICMIRQGSIDTLKTKYRCDVRFGVVNLQPEMTGVEMFGQA